jgi:hypothetical protein
VAVYVVVPDANARRPGDTRLSGMWTLTETKIAVTIDPGPEDGPIAGNVRCEEAEPRRFTGYVGLMAAIDAVLAEARERQG